MAHTEQGHAYLEEKNHATKGIHKSMPSVDSSRDKYGNKKKNKKTVQGKEK